jgi:hypothetical protein
MTSKGTAPSASRRVKYEIVVRGELSERFATTFLSRSLGSTIGPARVEPGDRTTAIVIEVIDQTHLLAVLERLRNLSLEIERVNPVHESAQPRREYAEAFVPREVTGAQSSGSSLVEIGKVSFTHLHTDHSAIAALLLPVAISAGRGTR